MGTALASVPGMKDREPKLPKNGKKNAALGIRQVDELGAVDQTVLPYNLLTMTAFLKWPCSPKLGAIFESCIQRALIHRIAAWEEPFAPIAYWRHLRAPMANLLLASSLCT